MAKLRLDKREMKGTIKYIGDPMERAVVAVGGHFDEAAYYYPREMDENLRHLALDYANLAYSYSRLLEDLLGCWDDLKKHELIEIKKRKRVKK